MARPAEKARSMLNKWVAMRESENKKAPVRQRRPHLASQCEHLADAEKFRGQLVREITSAMAKIQNPALGEHALRELNDEINHKMRQKFHWNKRIYELGGVNYNDIEKKRQIAEGGDAQSGAQYKYYGAAKDLPGVKEHLAKEAEKRTKVKRTDLYKNISPDYYGWRDEEDGVLLELESLAGRPKEHEVRKKRRVDEAEPAATDYLQGIPSQEEVAKALLEHKKKALLAKYAIE